MRPADVPGVHAATLAAFAALDAQRGETPEAPPPPRNAHLRIRHLLDSDPGGAWVAEAGGVVVGAALALVREGLWGLSLLVVRPDAQSTGTGRELLARAHDHAAGARGRVILASQDPRALRAYARLGLTLHPAARAVGRPRGVTAPPEVRPGTDADLPLADAVDRRVRGAAHGADLRAMTEAGAELLVLPERGYAVVRQGRGPWLVAAADEPAAATLLRAVLARAGDAEIGVEWLTARQGWAVPVCLDAGLELRTDGGALFLDGEVGPFAPYLPSGAYL
jgi:GNAT superfamily N-acetyltransferase